MPGYPAGVKVELDPHGGVSFDGDVTLSPSHYRVCFRRAFADWRVRDERTGQLYHVAGFNPEGTINVNWQDGGSHIFHDGPIYLDKDLNITFLPPVDHKPGQVSSHNKPKPKPVSKPPMKKGGGKK